MQRNASGTLRRLLVLIFLLAGTAPVSSAIAQDLRKDLEFYAYCETGPCTIFTGGKAGPYEYRSPQYSTEAQAKARGIGDYINKNGWDLPQPASVWRTKCGPVKTDYTEVSYNAYTQRWYGALKFTHTCQSYRPDGLSPPGNAYDTSRYLSIYGVCRPGFSMMFSNGECLRPAGDCAKYPDNKNFGCGKSIAQLETSTPAPSSPTYPFHVQQTCIARESCALRCDMDNCKWMDNVIPGFVDPYLKKQNSWQPIETSCTANMMRLKAKFGGNWVAKQECFALMGWYHVVTDLRNSLVVHGCGSQRDWNLVGERIEPCLRETQPGFPEVYYKFGSTLISAVRGEIRTLCEAERFLDGRPKPINDELKGQVCEVGP
ncbi:hypothetical protein HFK18_08325|uniref:hypothetical protein n=1 Tax=Stenotrophomonas sp. SbOxS2 TaxID=2723885 RepID=UPI0015D45F13|nr:hypothetical protein [Stenotrophomonas sp. SbOxS2]NYT98485.1 hypothetical protein [Stenotrophomonas sp. SbOxS2]